MGISLRLALICSLVMLAPILKAQEESAVEVQEEEKELLSITEISTKIEKNFDEIKEIDDELLLSQDLIELYERLPKFHDSLLLIFDEMNREYFSGMSFQVIENNKTEFNNYQRNVNDLKSNVSNRLDVLQENVGILDNLKAEWNEIKENQSDDDVVVALLDERMTPLIDSIEITKAKYKRAQADELVHFNLLDEISRLINQKFQFLTERETEIRQVLVHESIPIWELGFDIVDSLSFRSEVLSNLEERRTTAKKFYENNNKFILTLIVMFIAIGLLFIFNKKHAQPIFDKSGYPHLGLFFNKPLASAYIVSYFFIGFVTGDVPQIIIELILISLILPIAVLLHGFLTSWQRKSLYVYALFFTVLLFLEPLNLLFAEIRIFVLIFQLIVTIAAFIHVRNINLFINDLSLRSAVKLFSIIFLLTAFSSLVLNIFGSVQLSMLMLSGTIYSFGIGIVLTIWLFVTRAFALLIMNIPLISNLKSVKSNPRKANFLVFQIIGIYLFWEFLNSVAKQFDVKGIIVESWQEFVDKTYVFGKVEITIGDFLNSFLVLIIAIFIARFLKYLFGQEILTRFRFQRGVPNAVSTSIYYVVLTVGFFLAASSTGIDWSEVNLAIGAIGVGIGFGLQNVIYNFISGLILIYERPIQVGDVIEVGTLMGTVKEIGIRSSKLLTYDGSEVIVPNGNLVANEVINWTYTDQTRRWELIIKTDYSAEPEDVIEIIKEVIKTSENIIEKPEPMVLFTGYGDGTLDFRILFWAGVNVGLSTRSKAAVNIYKELQAKGHKMPMQTQAIVVESNELRNQIYEAPKAKRQSQKKKEE